MLEQNQQSKWKQFISVTTILVAVNAVIFLLGHFRELATGEDPLKEAGMLFANLPGYEHQYYRLFTCMFLHADIQHIVGNMLTLFFLGNTLERVVGHPKFSVIYLLGGLAGSMVQYVYYSDFTQEPTAMLGASGAIFAVVGAYVYVLIRHRKEINRRMLPRFILYIALSIYTGATTPGISLSAHLGGLVMGFLLAVLLYHPHSVERVE